MKSAFFSLCYVVFISFNTLGQNATKQETIDWLSSRLQYNQQWEDKNFYRLEVIKYDYQKDTLFYKVHYAMDGKASDRYRIEAIPIKDINPDRIVIYKMIGNSGDLVIYLYTVNGKKNIISRSYDLKENKPTKFVFNQSEVQLYFPISKLKQDGFDLPQRAVNAIPHLIRLSGGQGEKF